MKRYLAVVAAFFTLGAQAQIEGKLSSPTSIKEGKVIYQRTMSMNNMRFGPAGGANLPPELQAQLDKMPKTRTDDFELLFTSQHSLYQYLPNAVDEGGGTTSVSGGGVNIQMRMPGINDVTYIDFAKQIRLDQRDIMEKNFVVSDTLTRLQWKMSEETKPILNFIARKATGTTIVQRPRVTMENGEMKREMINDTIKVVGWYTTDVPVPAGPNFAGQLPGLILELDVNDGQSVTKAIEFSLKMAANKIKEPNDGKKITAAEFIKERDKVMEEMRKNNGRGDVIRMQ